MVVVLKLVVLAVAPSLQLIAIGLVRAGLMVCMLPLLLSVTVPETIWPLGSPTISELGCTYISTDHVLLLVLRKPVVTVCELPLLSTMVVWRVTCGCATPP